MIAKILYEVSCYFFSQKKKMRTKKYNALTLLEERHIVTSVVIALKKAFTELI